MRIYSGVVSVEPFSLLLVIKLFFTSFPLFPPCQSFVPSVFGFLALWVRYSSFPCFPLPLLFARDSLPNKNLVRAKQKNRAGPKKIPARTPLIPRMLLAPLPIGGSFSLLGSCKLPGGRRE